LLFFHRFKGNVLRSLGRARHLSRVLLREKSLRHNEVKVNGRDDHQPGDNEHGVFVFEDPLQAAFVKILHCVETALAQSIDHTALPMSPLAFQKSAAEHGRER
jgi:hypothetical protein